MQIEAHLVPEDAARTGAGPVAFFSAPLDDLVQEL
jgi:hypothetical protein